MRLLIFICLITAITACNSSKQITSAEPEKVVKKEMDPSDLKFSLSKTPCFGKCPVYDLNIYNNRYVEFIGKQNTSKLGTHALNLDKETYKNLISAFDKADFVGLKDHYESDILDLPTITMKYRKGAKLKTITGKRERPESVHKLQFLLEQVVEMQGWTFLSDETIKKREVVDKSKIVINIARGSQLSRWFASMKDKFGMQILQKLSNNSDSWLVGINPRVHNPDVVLEYLNNDPVVKDASFNVTLEEN